ncbi:uncharacterized protein LOC130678859 [Manis pentadactyla]|uniref:uncharacterized protein LOC130678859 n=1 Tax=Manis pentadactyla TaxID=143292 RepID=UPI00255D114E|nr:uncharacterized protein LOC130678859 [Manis pentadactyla]
MKDRVDRRRGLKGSGSEAPHGPAPRPNPAAAPPGDRWSCEGDQVPASLRCLPGAGASSGCFRPRNSDSHRPRENRSGVAQPEAGTNGAENYRGSGKGGGEGSICAGRGVAGEAVGGAWVGWEDIGWPTRAGLSCRRRCRECGVGTGAAAAATPGTLSLAPSPSASHFPGSARPAPPRLVAPSSISRPLFITHAAPPRSWIRAVAAAAAGAAGTQRPTAGTRRTWKPPGRARALAPAAAEAQREHLSAALSRQLNVNAKPFVPNVHAAEFVLSFLRGPAQPSPPPAGAGANHHGVGSGAGGPLAPLEPSQEDQLCEGSNSVVSMELSEPVVENGETEMSPEESWEHKEDISEAEPVGGSLGGGRPPEESAQEMMEEEEEILKPKSVVATPGAPKKEHVNVVFIGHVDAGKSTIGGQIILILEDRLQPP